MYFDQNPFYILNVLCSDKRSAITEAAEDLSFFGDEQQCSEAASALLNPVKRLKAEFGWFVDADRTETDKIRADIDAGSELCIELPSDLSELNLALYNFSLYDDDKIMDSFSQYGDVGLISDINVIDSLFSELSADKVASYINPMRRKAEMSEAGLADISAELNAKRGEIRSLISDKMNMLGDDLYGEVAEAIVDFDMNDGGAHPVFSDVIDQYEIRVRQRTEQISNEIKSLCEQIKNKESKDLRLEAANKLTELLKSFLKIVRPMQVKAKLNGLSYSCGETLARDVRNTGIELFNKHNDFEASEYLLKSLHEIAEDMPELRAQLDKDISTLDEQKDMASIVSNIQKLEACGKKIFSGEIKPNEGALEIKSILNSTELLVRKCHLLDGDSTNKVYTIICSSARSIAVDLCNKKNMYYAAAVLLKNAKDIAERNGLKDLSVKLESDMRSALRNCGPRTTYEEAEVIFLGSVMKELNSTGTRASSSSVSKPTFGYNKTTKNSTQQKPTIADKNKNSDKFFKDNKFLSKINFLYFIGLWLITSNAFNALLSSDEPTRNLIRFIIIPICAFAIFAHKRTLVAFLIGLSAIFLLASKSILFWGYVALFILSVKRPNKRSLLWLPVVPLALGRMYHMYIFFEYYVHHPALILYMTDIPAFILLCIWLGLEYDRAN
jgi:hypothetical protein